jgi:hypothetical protein
VDYGTMSRVAKKKVAKKKVGNVEVELRAENKKLKARLAAAEKSAEKWKARAKDQKSSTAGAKAELSTARRSLEKALASVTKWKDRAKAAVPPSEQRSGPTMAPAVPAAPAATMAPSTPDDTWTLTALRAEARARGLPGYSRKPKAQLLAELQG